MSWLAKVLEKNWARTFHIKIPQRSSLVCNPNTLVYKQHFYKQHRTEIGKKSKQKLSNTLRLNFWPEQNKMR